MIASLLLTVVLGANADVTNIWAQAQGIDRYGSLVYAVQCTIKNTSDKSEYFIVSLHGMNEWGHDVVFVPFTIRLEAGEKRKVIRRSITSVKEWRSIRAWRARVS